MQELGMRFLIVLIIIALLVFKFWPEPAVPPVEETFIGPQIQTLKKSGTGGTAIPGSARKDQ